MKFAEVLDLPALQEHHVYWPKVLTIDLQAYYSGLYNGHEVSSEIQRYIEEVGSLPAPATRDPRFLQSIEETARKGVLKADWGPNVIDRVMLPYAELSDGTVLDVRDVSAWRTWTLGRPEYNDFTKCLLGRMKKGEYLLAVDNVPGVYIIVLSSDDRIVCGFHGKGKQYGKEGKPTIVVGSGGRGPLCEMALYEVEEELGLTKRDFHFLDRNMKSVGWKKYVKPDTEKKRTMLYTRNISPFMILDKPDNNNPMAVFLARAEHDWNTLYKLLMKKKEDNDPDGAPDSWETTDFFPLEAEPEKLHEFINTSWKGSQSQATVLKQFADFLDKVNQAD